MNGGATWFSIPSGTFNLLRSVYFPDANTGYIAGNFGTILKTTDGGVSFIKEPTSHHSTFDIYPNPATDKITLKTSGKANGGILTILNIEGQQLISRQITQPKMQIEISTLPCGVYFLRVTTDRTVEVRKLIKQ